MDSLRSIHSSGRGERRLAILVARELYRDDPIGTGMPSDLEPQLGGAVIPPFGPFLGNAVAVEYPSAGAQVSQVFGLRRADPDHREFRHGSGANNWTTDGFHVF